MLFHFTRAFLSSPSRLPRSRLKASSPSYSAGDPHHGEFSAYYLFLSRAFLFGPRSRCVFFSLYSFVLAPPPPPRPCIGPDGRRNEIFISLPSSLNWDERRKTNNLCNFCSPDEEEEKLKGKEGILARRHDTHTLFLEHLHLLSAAQTTATGAGEAEEEVARHPHSTTPHRWVMSERNTSQYKLCFINNKRWARCSV